MTDRPPHPRPRPRAAAPAAPGAAARRAFTLIEMMTVIGIIVLILALSVPTFNALSGNRSTEAATNVLSATLGVARATAMSGGQTSRALSAGQLTVPRAAAGVCIYPDAATGKTMVALVDADANGNVDIIPDTDVTPLTPGVGAQLAVGVFPTSGTPPTNDVFLAVGFIMFNPNGTVSTQQYQIPADDTAGPYGAGYVNQLHARLHLKTGAAAPVFPGLAVALYDAPSYASQNFIPGDYAMSNYYDTTITAPTAYSPDEYNKEVWIAGKSKFCAVNQTNGTLVKGQ